MGTAGGVRRLNGAAIVVMTVAALLCAPTTARAYESAPETATIQPVEVVTVSTTPTVDLSPASIAAIAEAIASNSPTASEPTTVAAIGSLTTDGLDTIVAIGIVALGFSIYRDVKR